MGDQTRPTDSQLPGSCRMIAPSRVGQVVALLGNGEPLAVKALTDDRQRGWASWSGQRHVIRSRKSYRLLILSGRSLLLALAIGALVTALSVNGIIGHTAQVVLILPCALVFLVSWLLAVVALAIEAAHLSQTPLGRGPTQRQARFSSMFLVDLVTLRLLPRRSSSAG